MVTFKIRETGNELLEILEKELRAPGECRLTIDVLIPDVLKGDREGLYTSIALISQYLNRKLQECSVHIELSRETHSGESLRVKINVKGITLKEESTQHFLRVDGSDVKAFLSTLPYPTTFFANGIFVRFSFTMLFFTDLQRKYDSRRPSGKNILLVEDDDLTALVFISFMEEWEHHVTRVSDGISAVDTAKDRNHDIIFMDTFLPKMSGAEAIEKIREFDKKTPIIAVTTAPIVSDFTDRYTGANDVLIKPVNNEDLQKILTRHL